MNDVVRIRMTSKDGRDEVLDGRAFIGTMLDDVQDVNQTLCVGKLDPSTIRDLTTANISAFLTIAIERKEDPQDIFIDLNKMMVLAIQGAMEHNRRGKSRLTNYDFELLKETLDFATKMMKVTEMEI